MTVVALAVAPIPRPVVRADIDDQIVRAQSAEPAGSLPGEILEVVMQHPRVPRRIRVIWRESHPRIDHDRQLDKGAVVAAQKFKRVVVFGCLAPADRSHDTRRGATPERQDRVETGAAADAAPVNTPGAHAVTASRYQASVRPSAASNDTVGS
jgi:hypothetical protein